MAVAEVAAVGADRKPLIEADVFDAERAAVADLAEPRRLVLHGYAAREVVVRGDEVDVVVRHAGAGERSEHAVAGLEGLQRGREVVAGVKAADPTREHPDRCALAVLRPIGGCDDDARSAVVDERAHEQRVRIGDHARIEHILRGVWPTAEHHGLGIDVRVVAQRGGAVRELFARGAVERHVPAGLQRHLGGRGRTGPLGELITWPGVGRGRAVSLLLAAAERDRDHVGYVVAHHRGGVQQCGHAREMRREPHRVTELERHLTERVPGAGTGGKLERDDTVDVVLGHAGIVERAVERLEHERQRSSTEVPALLGGVDADNRDVSWGGHADLRVRRTVPDEGASTSGQAPVRPRVPTTPSIQ
ncbi:unannotated protein [freshwater metagenome]|uniref:Unannotated protein n=1 Tax=freshwater metagenome TaxID=449393 RepID=A0A6J7QNX3_9ZZZZ